MLLRSILESKSRSPPAGNNFFITFYRYLGYRPEEKFHYGRTFGDATAAYFQKKREETMKTSSVREAARKLTGIKQYPTANSHNLVLVLSARCKERRRLFETPKYTLSNTGVRDEEIDHFAKVRLRVGHSVL